MKKYFSIAIAVTLSLQFIGCSNLQEKTLPPPNIIWLISEDNSPLLGCYGDEYATTPNLDSFAEEGIKFINAFANAPVCAPSRSTLISGMYATSMGTQHMRSENKSPEFMKFFPYYLKQAGYYTSNRVKKDYNTIDQDSVWDITNWWGWEDALKDRKKEQPFFIMYNTWMSHESKIHPNSDYKPYFFGTMKAHGVDSATVQKYWDEAKHDPSAAPLAEYHPATDEIKNDYAKYYDCVELMDREMGRVIDLIKADGYWENTIVFYFSDHGGVLPRSKRYTFESGLKVPFLLHVPEKYKELINGKSGTVEERVVSFVDLAPTMLSLAGIDVPEYMEGKSFTGKGNTEAAKYSFGFRGRMDERYDMVRTVRDKRFRYIKNFMPHRIYGGKVKYLWKAKSMQSWEQAFSEGECNETQSVFWKRKPTEEFYDIIADPDNVNNLADNPKYKNEVNRMREVLKTHLINTKDLGFVPEAEMVRRSSETTPYDFIRGKNIPFKKIFETANIASEGKPENINILIERLSDSEPAVRYWAATGLAVLKEQSQNAKNKLIELLDDGSVNVKIASAEALFYLDEEEKSISTLTEILKLPKMTLEDNLDNKELYANHFAITHALNVIDALDINTEKINKIIKQIANSQRADNRDYDKRIAGDIVKKMQ